MEQISNEEIIKKMAQCPIVLVSDDNKTWIERILIDTNIDDSCNIVLALYKERFLLGKGYLSCTFKFWKPYLKSFRLNTVEKLTSIGCLKIKTVAKRGAKQAKKRLVENTKCI